MFKSALVPIAFACLLRAEDHPMTLRQAVETALKQSPDITLARLDEVRSRQGVLVAKDPFTPHLVIGSGLAYSDGFPMSIEGSAPSVLQANVVAALFNRQQSLQVAQAKENARGAALGVTSKRDEVVFRTASLYQDAERSGRLREFANKEIESLRQVLETVQTQVREGRALPLAEKTAAANLAHARQAAELLDDDVATAETALAMALGYSAEDRVHPVAEERRAPELPKSQEEAINAALDANKDLRRLESQITAKELEKRGVKAQRLPHADLVAQYALLAKFNNYAEFFSKYQMNNEQIGMSFQIPFAVGPGVGAQVAQVESDIAHLKVELNNARNKMRSDMEQAFRDVHKSETAAEVARLDLDVAREQLSVNLAQMQEGRTPLRQVEESRVAESEKWIAFYDAQYGMEKARWSVLRLTGELLAAVEAQ
jgi:outer membrane protein TolC